MEVDSKEKNHAPKIFQVSFFSLAKDFEMASTVSKWKHRKSRTLPLAADPAEDFLFFLGGSLFSTIVMSLEATSSSAKKQN